ncbi:hypothetical protein OV203_29515 [Nannocystis sp. ILAH1]|uniref:hypothetical protein n=1 Tax=unclassified Nannocystis TaxID=2627009 RepID=UPI00226D95A6|nr:MULTISPECIES: hypothetical protein [unclassified Nannocystis]MCY0991322.1 hypothetical protein [Nannocystis sp. ILAH1]MCY1066370.1 hypothetical protein [Nannocystis sp. RBIL2]
MSRGPSLWFAALVLVACQREPEVMKETKADPFAVVAAIDTRASSYKDPLPPTTSPPPGMNPRTPRPAINATEVQLSGRTRVEAVERMFFRVPVEWVAAPSEPPDARPGFVLPGPGGEARLDIRRFAAAGVDPTAYVRQWRSQFMTEAGAPLSDEQVRVQEMVRGPLEVTLADMAGTYAAPVGPDAKERYNDPGYRMMAAIVEYRGETYLFTAVGPALTMAIWEHAFADFAASFAPQFPS